MRTGIDIIPLKFCDYNDTELLNVIEHLYNNMRTLANAIDNSRPDIAQALDSIIDYPTVINDVGIESVPVAGIINDSVVITVDHVANRMHILDANGNSIENTAMIDSIAAKKKLTKIGGK